jgi:hypothetical protein
MREMIRRLMLGHAHPVKFVAELVGILCGLYFLWIHNWIAAIVSSVALFLGSTLLLWKKPIDYLEDTRLGRIMLAYGTPFNFAIYNLSALPVIYGAWTHSIPYIIVGYLIMLAPLLWGLKKQTR